MFDWSDLRIFLAVMRRGSTLAAARHLRISQSTAARRVAALEHALGQSLFDRRRDGYSPTAAARALLPGAEAVEREALAVAERAAALGRGAAGTVRLTTIDIAASGWIVPLLPEFQKAWPGVHVEIMTTDEKLDLLRGEADVGLRFGPPPREEGFVVRRLGEVRSALYCSLDYAAARGRPEKPETIGAGHSIIRGAGYIDTRPEYAWLAARAPLAVVAHRSSSTMGIMEAVRAGIGIGWLPTAVADADPKLVQLFPAPPELAAGAWIVTAEGTRRLPHVRAFLDFFGTRLARLLR